MVSLMYRAEVKIGTLLKLIVADYDQKQGFITLPGGQVVTLDATAKEHLESWLETRSRLGISAAAPLFCSVSAPQPGKELYSAYVRQMLIDAGRRAGIQKRVNPESLRASRREHRQALTNFDRLVAEQLEVDPLLLHYPDAVRKWLDARELLDTAGERLGPQIQRLCAEACDVFLVGLLRRYGLAAVAGATPSDNLELIAAEVQESGSDSPVADWLIGIGAVWDSMSARAQHAAAPAVTVDAVTREVLMTLLMMREIAAVLGDRSR